MSLWLVTVLVAPALAGPAYIFTDLGSLGRYSSGYAINLQGAVAGYSVPKGDGPWIATLWKHRKPTDLGPADASCRAWGLNKFEAAAGECAPHGSGDWRAVRWDAGTPAELAAPPSRAWGINNTGDVVGQSLFPNTGAAQRATRWVGTTAVDLGALHAGRWSAAYAINAAGKIVGVSGTADGWPHAALWQSDRVIDLGTLGGLESHATAINDRGEVVGYSFTAKGQVRAAYWFDGAIVDLGALDGNHSYAWGINSAGTIVGHSHQTRHAKKRNQRAVMWVDFRIVDMNTLLDDATRAAGWVLIEARAINDLGQITGTAKNTVTHKTHAFLLTPP